MSAMIERQTSVRLFTCHPLVQQHVRRILARKRRVIIVENEIGDVGIVDGALPDAQSELHRARARFPEMHFLLISSSPGVHECVRWLKDGASGIVDYDQCRHELLPAIIHVSKGRPWCSVAVLNVCLGNSFPEPEAYSSGLTEREKAIARLLSGKMLCNKEIADQLRISERTVKFHFNNMFGKLNVTSRSELRLSITRNNLSFY